MEPVRRATTADLPRLIPALAAAFDGDPPLQFLVPGTNRQALLERYFGAYLPIYLRRGEVWTADDIDGAAAWAPPGAWPFGGSDAVALLPTMLRVFARRPRRALAAERADLAGRPAERYWFLDFIGIAPDAQAAGAGSRLLAAKLAELDALASPAYLNAGSERSRDLYLRHGFATTGSFELPGGGPPLWRMWRAG